MNNISRATITHASPYAEGDAPTEPDFNAKVLSYIEQNQPRGSLSDLLDQLRALSPDEVVPMRQLNAALLSADAQMRKKDEYKEYTDSTLDKLTTRAIGVRMFFNNMLYKNFTQSDD